MSPLNFLQIPGTTNIARVYSAKIRNGINKNWRKIQKFYRIIEIMLHCIKLSGKFLEADILPYREEAVYV